MSATETPMPSAAASPAAPAPSLASAAASKPGAAPSLAGDVAAQANRNAWLWLVLAALAGVSLVGNVLLWGKLSGIQQHLAEGSVQAQNTAQEAKALAQTMAERAESNQAKLALLDARLQEMDALNRQVEAIVQQATRTQNSNLLTDLESALRLAEQQAQFTRNAQPLLDALIQAQTRLEQSGDAAVLLKPASAAIAQDLARLKTANYPDVNAAVDQLDELILRLDQLPLWIEAPQASAAPQSEPAKKSRKAKADKTATATPSPTAATAATGSSAWLQSLSAAGQSIWQEARSLVQVVRTDNANPAAMSRQEAALLREQMKLYVLSARTAMLSGRLATAAQTLAQLQSRLPQYFDRHSRSYRQTDAELSEIRALLGSGSSAAPQAQASIAAIALLNERLSAIPLGASLPVGAATASSPGAQKGAGAR